MKGFNTGAYAAQWGISDFYDEDRQALLDAIRSGEDFDTGNFGAKKEIHYGRIRRQGDLFFCEAWCYDDFDTEGYGEAAFSADQCEDQSPEGVLLAIEEGLCVAMDAAEANRCDNEVYEGFCIGPINLETGDRVSWIYTYLAPMGEGLSMEGPPGDNYEHWGWQENPEQLSPEQQRDFEAFAEDSSNEEPGMTVGTWRIDRWKP